jgi:MoxR-like ATPase
MEKTTVIENAIVRDDAEIVGQAGAFRERFMEAIGHAIIGQQETIELILTALLAGGHCLLTGVPGLAKTLIVQSTGQLLGLKFHRIQFTPDLMPSDILGTDILEEDRATGRREFRFIEGPLFANLVLADEVNRTPPKTQSALLEAMQERRVTTCGRTLTLDEPFFVLATQNPIEQAGTYKLPEAQLDRFMFNLLIGFVKEDEEVAIVQATTSKRETSLTPIVDHATMMEFQGLARSVPVSDHVARYAVRLAAATRPGSDNPLDFVNKYVTWGAGIRGGQQLVLAAKARALLHGRHHVTTDDIRRLAAPALRHRIICNYFAEADGYDTDKIIAGIIEKVPEPRSGIR